MTPVTKNQIKAADASRFARMALAGITREFPNKPGDVLLSPRDAVRPKTSHPAFYGCFDWHSSVHGHWMLVRLLKLFPDLPEVREIRRKLGANLTRQNLLREVAYFARAEAKSFERPYGWAWLLKLALELAGTGDRDMRQWSQNLKPLVTVIVKRYLEFLPRSGYPIRTGLHNNTAFGLSFAFDYAEATGLARLKSLIVRCAREHYLKDAAYPALLEPSGSDFLSPALAEADLMRRVLTPAAFRRWFKKFLPELKSGRPRGLLVPAKVGDRSDPQIVHLDGLNLSRAWCMRAIAPVLTSSDPARAVLRRSARLHAKAGLAHIESGDYGGEHWLASFAVLLMSVPEPA
jgi:hypothetical protein